MSVACMPLPRRVFHACHQICWIRPIEIEDVESILRPLHLHDELSLAVISPQKLVLQHDLASTLRELTKTDNVVLKLGNIVHVSEYLVTSILQLKQNSASSCNLHLQPIAKSNGACNREVQLRKLSLVAGHVVASACVEVPNVVSRLHPPREDLLFHERDDLRSRLLRS